MQQTGVGGGGDAKEDEEYADYDYDDGELGYMCNMFRYGICVCMHACVCLSEYDSKDGSVRVHVTRV